MMRKLLGMKPRNQLKTSKKYENENLNSYYLKEIFSVLGWGPKCYKCPAYLPFIHTHEFNKINIRCSRCYSDYLEQSGQILAKPFNEGPTTYIAITLLHCNICGFDFEDRQPIIITNKKNRIDNDRN